VVSKGAHWIGEQLPIIGGGETHTKLPAPPAAPISLLPSAGGSDGGGKAAAGKPGPGSGGLY